MRAWLDSVPLFPLILFAGVLFTAVFAARVNRITGLPVAVVVGLGCSLSLIAAATLSPAPSGLSGACLTAMDSPMGRGLLVRSDRMLNTWLFVPLGFFAGLAAVRRAWVLVAAFAVTFAVEGLQRLLPELGRRCQFQDLVDNTWGLILGAILGFAVGVLLDRVPRAEQP
ncbi:MAG: VanZ family protein [Candidatus Nanopelagicales bacterium]|nr:VanZ family protein [Candidatus Nanopelagicales bacterium]